jgi:hypothetical protein
MKKTTVLTIVAAILLIQTPSFGNSPSRSRPRRTASKSWCLGIIEQWQFRMQHFGRNDPSIRAMFEESNCGYWGLTFPGSNSNRRNPNYQQTNNPPQRFPTY